MTNSTKTLPYESLSDCYGNFLLIKMPEKVEAFFKRVLDWKSQISSDDQKEFVQLVKDALREDARLAYALIDFVNGGISYNDRNIYNDYLKSQGIATKPEEALILAWSTDPELIQFVNTTKDWELIPYLIDPNYQPPKDPEEWRKHCSNRSYNWVNPSPTPEQYHQFPSEIQNALRKREFMKSYNNIQNEIRKELDRTYGHQTADQWLNKLSDSEREEFFKEKTYSNNEWMKILEEKWREYLDSFSTSEVDLTSDCEIERELTRRVLGE